MSTATLPASSADSLSTRSGGCPVPHRTRYPRFAPPILWIRRLQAGPGSRDRAPAGRPIGGGRVSHRRRQVALLPIAGAGAAGPDAGGLAADCPDERPDRCPCRPRHCRRRLDSTLDVDEYRAVIDEVRSGRLRLLYVAPERFVNERFCEMIQRTAISLFAVDEAHCISEWGHNFRPDYLRLARFAQLCRAERVLALTATATPQVLADICRFFHIEPGCAVRTGFYRPNLTLLGTPVTLAERDQRLHDALAHREPRADNRLRHAATHRRGAGRPAGQCRASPPGLSRRHGGRPRAARRRTGSSSRRMASSWPRSPSAWASTRPISATSTTTILPRAWRTTPRRSAAPAATGRPATCEMFFCPDDLNVLENFAYGDTPNAPAVAGLVAEIFGQGDDFDVSVYDLSSRHDIRNTVARTLLTYLELLGHIEAGTPFYAEYQFKPLVSSAEILGHFEGPRKAFLQKLLGQAKRRKRGSTSISTRRAETSASHGTAWCGRWTTCPSKSGWS